MLRHLAERRRAGQLRELAFTPMGGAYNRVPVDATAFVHRTERFLLEHLAEVGADPPEPQHEAKAWVACSWACTHPWGSGRVYPNFPDPELDDWVEAYFGSNHARLRAVKRAYDPENVFHFHQSLAP